VRVGPARNAESDRSIEHPLRVPWLKFQSELCLGTRPRPRNPYSNPTGGRRHGPLWRTHGRGLPVACRNIRAVATWAAWMPRPAVAARHSCRRCSALAAPPQQFSLTARRSPAKRHPPAIPEVLNSSHTEAEKKPFQRLSVTPVRGVRCSRTVTARDLSPLRTRTAIPTRKSTLLFSSTASRPPGIRSRPSAPRSRLSTSCTSRTYRHRQAVLDGRNRGRMTNPNLSTAVHALTTSTTFD
jgi:hypothetical protein